MNVTKTKAKNKNAVSAGLLLADLNELVRVEGIRAEAESPLPVKTEQLPSSLVLLDGKPLTQRITEALGEIDRITKDRLRDLLNAQPVEFGKAVIELVESKSIMEDAVAKTLYLPLTEEERKNYKTDLAVAKSQDRFLALQRIHDRYSYREEYSSWEKFLWHEMDRTLDWWEREKRQARVQQLMDERELKLKVPLDKRMADQLNRVRDYPELFVRIVAEFQALPMGKQNSKALGEIVKRTLDRKNRLASLLQFVPDATEEELGILAPIYAADYRWRCWYPQHTKALQEQVQTTGKSPGECILDIASEIKALPNDVALLGIARGQDLLPIVNELTKLLDQWDRDQKQSDEVRRWEIQGKKLGVFKVESVEDTETEAEDDPQPTVQENPQDAATEAAVLYDVELTGDLGQQPTHEGISADELAELLRDIAESIEDGADISNPSSIVIQPK